MNLFLATVAMSVIFNSAVSLASAESVELKPFEQMQMDVYLIRASNVSSVDVLIDYEMVEVDCHGLDKSYTSVINPVTKEIFVTSKYNNQLHNSCVLPITAKAQDGIKLTLNSAVGMNSVTQTLFAPAGSKVKIVEHRNQAALSKGYRFECGMDQNVLHLVSISSKLAGEDGYTLQADYLRMGLDPETGLASPQTIHMVGDTTLSNELTGPSEPEISMFEFLAQDNYSEQLIIAKTEKVGEAVAAKQIHLTTGEVVELNCTLTSFNK